MGTGTQDQAGSSVSAARQQSVVLWGTPKASTGVWASNQTLPAPILLSDGAQNASVSYDVALAAGTYTLDLLHDTYTNRGIYTVALDGVTIATQDGYGAVSARLLSTFTGIVVADGAHVLSFTLTTKNASSSAYTGALTEAVFTRTA